MDEGDGRRAGGLLAGDRCVRAVGGLRGDGKLLFPHPLPLPRGGVLGVWRGGSRGRGGRCAVDGCGSRAAIYSDGKLMFPHPLPLPRGAVLGVSRGGSRGRGGMCAGDGCGSRAAIYSDGKLLFPHPLPLPRDGVLGVSRGGSRGRGGTCGRRLWLARGDLSGRQVDVPPPPAPPPRWGFGCLAGRVSRERGDGLLDARSHLTALSLRVDVTVLGLPDLAAAETVRKGDDRRRTRLQEFRGRSRGDRRASGRRRSAGR